MNDMDIMSDVNIPAPEVVAPDGKPLVEHVYTNDPANPYPSMIFRMVHEAAYKNLLGVMHALDKDTGKVVTLIVGMEPTKQGTHMWPLAKILTEEEYAKYLAPDGDGGYSSV